MATASFKVSRQKLLEKRCAPQIKSQLQIATATSIKIENHSIGAIELWMRCFHDAMTEETYVLPIRDVWNAIAFGRHFDFDLNDLKDLPIRWFSKFRWPSVELDDLCQLLYPSYAFELPLEFSIISKRMAMQGGHPLSEINPRPRFADLHVPTPIVDMLFHCHYFHDETIVTRAKARYTLLKVLCKRGLWLASWVPPSSNYSAPTIAHKETTLMPRTTRKFIIASYGH